VGWGLGGLPRGVLPLCAGDACFGCCCCCVWGAGGWARGRGCCEALLVGWRRSCWWAGVALLVGAGRQYSTAGWRTPAPTGSHSNDTPHTPSPPSTLPPIALHGHVQASPKSPREGGGGDHGKVGRGRLHAMLPVLMPPAAAASRRCCFPPLLLLLLLDPAAAAASPHCFLLLLLLVLLLVLLLRVCCRWGACTPCCRRCVAGCPQC
jgi:hypothetical protein